MDRNNKFTKLDRNMDVSEEEFKTLQELERNDDGFKDEENPKYKKAGSPIAPLGGGDALYFDYSDEYPAFEDVIAIQFQPAGKVYWYYYPDQKLPGNELQQGDIIVAYSERGMELAKVLNKSMDDFKRQNKINFIKNGFIRKAEPADFEHEKKLEASAQNAKEVILRINKELGIKMKVIKVKYTLDDVKAIFYFSANGRVDFRELIKRLAYELKRRIEMRQIGVRDTTKIMGGLGPCGRELCCGNHMHNFLPVSIKMAKDQNFSLNPNKISGICGRLFCCLGYENPTYEELRKEYPEEEMPIFEKQSNRKGFVKKVNVIAKNISVFFPENPEKKEKAEEKIFPQSSFEFKERWLINAPQNDTNSSDLKNIVPPTVPREKEILLGDRNEDDTDNSEIPPIKRAERPEKPQDRPPRPNSGEKPKKFVHPKRNPGQGQQQNNAQNGQQGQGGNRRNFKKYPPRKEGSITREIKLDQKQEKPENRQENKPQQPADKPKESSQE